MGLKNTQFDVPFDYAHFGGPLQLDDLPAYLILAPLQPADLLQKTFRLQVVHRGPRKRFIHAK